MAGMVIGPIVIGASRPSGHLPPSRTRPCYYPPQWARPGTGVLHGFFRISGEGRLSGEQMSGHMMLTGGRGL